MRECRGARVRGGGGRIVAATAEGGTQSVLGPDLAVLLGSGPEVGNGAAVVVDGLGRMPLAPGVPAHADPRPALVASVIDRRRRRQQTPVEPARFDHAPLHAHGHAQPAHGSA